MFIIHPPCYVILHAVDIFFFRWSEVLRRVRDVEVIHHHRAAWLEALGDVVNNLIIFIHAFEVAKACEEIKYEVKIILPECQAHVVLKELEIVTLMKLSLTNTGTGKIQACDSIAF